MVKLFSIFKPIALLLPIMLLFTSCSGVIKSSISSTENPSDAITSGEGTTINGSAESVTGTVSDTNSLTVSQTPEISSTPTLITSPAPSLTPIGKPLPVTSSLLCYMGDISKTTFMPSVAYMENDVIKGTMYDTFLFLSTLRVATNAKTKADWEFYINKIQFATGSNLDALEKAVEETKRALGKNFKVNVILSVYNLNSAATNFGNINGKNLNLSNLEDRKAALKWLVDEQVKQFKAKHYRNLNLVGFYWFPESIYTYDMELIRSFTDYVRSIGYFSCWIPYHGADGLNSSKTACGFDKVNMQFNYFPGEPLPNNYAYSDFFKDYTFKQTYELAESEIKNKDFSYGMEFGGNVKNQKSVTGFKIYMKYGVKYGFMNNYLAYYMNGGPSEIRDLYKSTDQYVQSTYSQLHKFIKKSLTEAEITIRPTHADVMPVKDW